MVQRLGSPVPWPLGLWLFSFLRATTPARADFTGPVVSVLDGNTIQIQFAKAVHTPRTSTILAVAVW